MRLKAGDKVMVISGKDTGKVSRIDRVLPRKNQVIVEGVNTSRKHQKQRGQTMQGGIIDKDMPIDASNVMVVCDDCGEPTRISFRIDDNGKQRVCSRCGGDL